MNFTGRHEEKCGGQRKFCYIRSPKYILNMIFISKKKKKQDPNHTKEFIVKNQCMATFDLYIKTTVLFLFCQIQKIY